MAKKLSREAASNELSSLREAISSLKSCLPNEVPNEAQVLRRQMNVVETMQTLRHSQEIENRRHNLCKEADRVLMQRSA